MSAMNDYFVRVYPPPEQEQEPIVIPLYEGNAPIEPEPMAPPPPARPTGRRMRCFLTAGILAIIAAGAAHIIAGPPEWPPIPQFVVLGALCAALYYLVVFAICDREEDMSC